MLHPEILLVVTSAEEAQYGVLVAYQIAARSGFCLRVLVASESAERVKAGVVKQYAALLEEANASSNAEDTGAEERSKSDDSKVDLAIDCLGTDASEVIAYINSHLTLRLVVTAGLQNWGDLRSAIFEHAHCSVACFESHPSLGQPPTRFHVAKVASGTDGKSDSSVAKWLAEHWAESEVTEFDAEEYLAESGQEVATLEQAGDISVIVLVADRQQLGTARKLSRRVMDQAHPPVVVVRGEVPWLHYWLHAALPSKIAKVIPQMDRETRRSLAENLTTYSKLDFEFITLICAATFLAAFGLVQNSAAVIIGAMLVAPLMTPILGAGLSLAQGNRPLFSSSLRTIIVGFFAALLTSALFGCLLRLTPNSFLHREGSEVWLTSEMWSRTTPGIIDFLVGAVGGAAAAFARTRGHLSSALAGAAIAAALVPPIATSGLQLSLVAMHVYEPDGQRLAHNLIYGPTLLFVANMLTIMIGASLVLWACGVRSETQYSLLHRWSTRMVMLLLLLTAIVAVWIVQNP